MAKKNRSVHTRNSYNRMLNSYLGSQLRSSQSMQRRQNYPCPNNSIIQDTNHIQQGYQDYPSPNSSILGTSLMLSCQNYPDNSSQGLYHENNIVGARTQPMMPLAFTSNNSGSLMSATRDGGVSLLSLPRDPPINMGSLDILPSLRSRIGSVENSLLNNNNLSYRLSGINNMNHFSLFKDVNNHPSNNMNNSSLFKDPNPYPRIDMNSFKSEKDVNMRNPPLIPILAQTSLNRSGSSDLTRERALKRPLCEVEGVDIIGSSSKMPRMSSTPPNFYEIKDIDLPESMIDASEGDEEDIDLWLHL